MRKVLIITYYWPPSGGSGVQRWLKFTRYLPELGWEPIVFTPENPSFEVRDNSLLNDISDEVEVIKLPIWEPLQLVQKVKGKGKQQSDLVKRGKKGLFDKLMLWVRGNFFIPDPRRYWIKPAVGVLSDIIQSNKIEVVITTGPPHSMHLIGLKLKKKLGIKWLADFRDPWTKWDLLDTFYLTSWARRRHQRLERRVLQQADTVVTISDQYAKELAELSSRNVEVVTNGYDEQEFEPYQNIGPQEEFVIRHVGLVDELRDPTPLLEALHELLCEDRKWAVIHIEFVGNVNQALKDKVQENELLKEQVRFRPYVPHAEVLKLYRQSSVLLLVLADSQNAQGNIPGKLFEYLASERRILGIGSSAGDSANIIKEAEAGVVCDPHDIAWIKKELVDMYEKRDQKRSLTAIQQYSRKNLTQKLATLLDRL